MRLPRAILVIAALCLAGLDAATAGVVAHASASKTTVTVTEREFKIALSKRVVKPGIVRLVVRNAGKYPHALAIKGKGVPTRKTPVLKPGASAVLAVDLRSGSYSIWCPVPGHAARGMKTTLSLPGADATSTRATTTNGTTTTQTYPEEPPGY